MVPKPHPHLRPNAAAAGSLIAAGSFDKTFKVRGTSIIVILLIHSPESPDDFATDVLLIID